MLTMAKTFEKLLTPTLNKITVSVLYGSSTPLVLYAGLNNQLWRMQIKKMKEKRKKPKTVTLFPKWNINIKIQSQSWQCTWYMLQWSTQANRKIHLCKRKTPINKLSRNKAPKTKQVVVYKHERKTYGLFYGTKRAPASLASEIILLTYVPLQKFPLLYNRPFLAYRH